MYFSSLKTRLRVNFNTHLTVSNVDTRSIFLKTLKNLYLVLASEYLLNTIT